MLRGSKSLVCFCMTLACGLFTTVDSFADEKGKSREVTTRTENRENNQSQSGGPFLGTRGVGPLDPFTFTPDGELSEWIQGNACDGGINVGQQCNNNGDCLGGNCVAGSQVYFVIDEAEGGATDFGKIREEAIIAEGVYVFRDDSPDQGAPAPAGPSGFRDLPAADNNNQFIPTGFNIGRAFVTFDPTADPDGNPNNGVGAYFFAIDISAPGPLDPAAGSIPVAFDVDGDGSLQGQSEIEPAGTVNEGPTTAPDEYRFVIDLDNDNSPDFVFVIAEIAAAAGGNPILPGGATPIGALQNIANQPGAGDDQVIQRYIQGLGLTAAQLNRHFGFDDNAITESDLGIGTDIEIAITNVIMPPGVDNSDPFFTDNTNPYCITFDITADSFDDEELGGGAEEVVGDMVAFPNPDIEVTKVVRCIDELGFGDTATGAPGTRFEYEITVQNWGSNDINVVLSDVLADLNPAVATVVANACDVDAAPPSVIGVQFPSVGAFCTALEAAVTNGTDLDLGILPSFNGCDIGAGAPFTFTFQVDVGPDMDLNDFCDDDIDVTNSVSALGTFNVDPIPSEEEEDDNVDDEFTALDNDMAGVVDTPREITNGNQDDNEAFIELECRNSTLEKFASAGGSGLQSSLNLTDINGGNGPIYPQNLTYTYQVENNGEVSVEATITETNLCDDVNSTAGVSFVNCGICTDAPAEEVIAADPGNTESATCVIQFANEVALMNFLQTDDAQPNGCGDPGIFGYDNCVTGTIQGNEDGFCVNPVDVEGDAQITFIPECALDVNKTVRCVDTPPGPDSDSLTATPGAILGFDVDITNTDSVPIAQICLTDVLSCPSWLVGGSLTIERFDSIADPTGDDISGEFPGFSPTSGRVCALLNTPLEQGEIIRVSFNVQVPENFNNVNNAVDCVNEFRAECYSDAAADTSDVTVCGGGSNDCSCEQCDEDPAEIDVIVPRNVCDKLVAASGDTQEDGPFDLGPASSVTLPFGITYPVTITYSWELDNPGQLDLDMTICDQGLVNAVNGDAGLSFGTCDISPTGCETVTVAAGGSNNSVSCEIFVASEEAFIALGLSDGDNNEFCYNNESDLESVAVNLPDGLCQGEVDPDPVSCDAQLCFQPDRLDCPPCTYATFAIWNQNEIRFSGTDRCLCSWEQSLMSQYGIAGNHFLYSNIQTDMGKARVNAISEPVCNDPTEEVPMLGVLTKHLQFPSQDVKKTEEAMIGIGAEAGLLKYDVDNGGPAIGGPQLITDNDVAQTSRNGSVLAFIDVQVRWDLQGNVLTDTIIELSNDLDTPTWVQLYLTSGPLCEFVDNNFLLTQNEPTYWSAATGEPKGLSPAFQLATPVYQIPGDTDSPVIGLEFRGYVVVWTTLVGGEEIAHNGLTGAANIIDYTLNSARTYPAWAFRALNTPLNQQTIDTDGVTSGRLRLDGFEYSAAPDTLLFDFYTVGATLPGGGGVINVPDSELTFWIPIKDFRLSQQ